MDANHTRDDEAKLGSAASSASATAAAAGDGRSAGSSLTSSTREESLLRLLQLVQAGDDQHAALRQGLEALTADERKAVWTAKIQDKIVFNVGCNAPPF